MDKIRFGIAGCGSIARTHARVISSFDNAELCSCWSKTFSSAEKLASEFQCEAFASFEEFINSDIDVVTICSPSGNHYEQAKEALYAGKHVIVEKPVCLKVEEVDELISIAEEKTLKLCPISQTRFSDAVQAIKKQIDNGSVGKLISCQLMMRYYRGQEYYDQASWRGTYALDGGGVLMNQGIHGIDILCYLFGDISSVMGYTTRRMRDIEGEDTVAMAVEFKNGALGVVDCTSCSNPSFTKNFILGFENGTVILENDKITKWTIPGECPESAKVSVAGATSSNAKAVSDVYHTREYLNIINALTGKENLLVDGLQGRKPLSVILGLYQSAKTGKKVVL